MQSEPKTARAEQDLRFFRAADCPVAEPKEEVQDSPVESSRKIPATGAFLLTLACALFACFPKVIIGVHTWFFRDYGAYLYPLNVFTRNSLLRGELPLWNPYSQCGVPHMAQLGSWYPPTLLAIFLPLPWSLNIVVVLHLLWAGLGVYLLAGRWSIGTFAATFAGVAAVFNGVILSSMEWSAYIAVLSWTPWIVLLAMQSWEKGGRWIVLAALASGMQILGGMPELVVLTWVFLGVLWVAMIAAHNVNLSKAPLTLALSPSDGERAKHRETLTETQNRMTMRGSALRTVWIVLLASGLTSFQMLPFLDLVTHSQRNLTSASGTWSMAGWGWANLIVPLFHCYQSPQGVWFQAGQDVFASYYLGVGVVLLAVIGAWRTRNYAVWALAGMALFCWVMALGTNGLVYDWVRKVFPVIGFSRFPVKFAAFPALLVPLLAAWGIKRLFEAEPARALRYMAIAAGCGVMLTCALLWFAKQYPSPNDQWSETAQNALMRLGLMGLLFACLIALRRIERPKLQMCLRLAAIAILPLDALTHSPGLPPSLATSVLAPEMWQSGGKPEAPKLGEGRIMVSPAAEQQLTFSYVSDFNVDVTGKRLGEWYNFNLLDEIPKVTGAIPLHSPYFDSFEKRLYYTSGVIFGPGLLDFLSARWYSSETNPTRWGMRSSALAVLTCGQKPLFQSDNATLDAMFAPDFNASKVVYLPEGARALVTTSNQQPSKITAAAMSANKIEASIESAGPAMMVISQTYYHLWNAFVDERPVPLFRANFAFQALEVPAGAHRVKLIYRDYNLALGFYITLASLVVCGLLWRKLKHVNA
jgi:hypothetical protein